MKEESRDVEGEPVKELDSVEDTLCEGEAVKDTVREEKREGDGGLVTFELVLGDRVTVSVTVTVWDTEEEDETVEEIDGVGEVEGDLEEERVTEIDTVVDRVRVPLEEVLGDKVPDKDLGGEREMEGEMDSVEDEEELGQRVELREGDRLREGLLVKVGEAVKEFVMEDETLEEEEEENFELVLGDSVPERVTDGDLD